MSTGGRVKKKWKEEHYLGSGTFGIVRLFSSDTGDKIALKEMKVDALHNLQPSERDKMLVRLKNEIKIMWEHDHPNLIKALMAPLDIPYNPPEGILHVWMEFCEGGDLRNGVLGVPENCCGVEEKQFRQICSDINRGIRYLHKISVIHRDLKPENILIKHTDNKTVVYKLTDFGYAKAYGLSSKAESLVGTPQYVAPEIIDEDQHGRAVDYWSFGVVAFELVTGIRPFLHNSKRPLEWIGPVGGKPDNCICITFGDVGLNMSENLPSPHQLSSVFAEELTKWLQIVLHQKPERRGSTTHQNSSEEAPCLLQMDSLLQTKVLNIVCMTKGHVLSFHVKDDSNLESLRVWLRQRHYPIEQQYLVTPQGKLLDSQNQDLKSLLEWESDITTVYLFCKDQVPSFRLVGQVTASVQNLITKGDDKLHKNDRQLHFVHAYSHIREQERLFWRIHNGHKAILNLIDPLCNELRQSGVNISAVYKCLGAAEFVKDMHSSDLERLKEYLENETDWKRQIDELGANIQQLNRLSSEVHDLQQETRRVLTTAEVMHQLVMSSQQHFNNFNAECVMAALQIVRCEKTSSPHSHMSDLLTKASQTAESIIQEHLNRVDFLSVYLDLIRLCDSNRIARQSLLNLKDKCYKISQDIHMKMWSLIQSQSQFGPDVTQSVNSVFNGRINRSNSVASCNSILLRLRSQSSVSSESVDADGEDLKSLVGSLKQEILAMVDMSVKEIKKNEEIRSSMIVQEKESSGQSNFSSSD